jgi:hypothetical protein
VRAFEAKERSDAFRRHNLASLEQVLPVWEDEAQRTHLARSARDQLEQQMERDRADLDRRMGTGWYSNPDAEGENGDERSPAALK